MNKIGPKALSLSLMYEEKKPDIYSPIRITFKGKSKNYFATL